jgi:sugar/nucleoside kinase (ribokinase family)
MFVSPDLMIAVGVASVPRSTTRRRQTDRSPSLRPTYYDRRGAVKNRFLGGSRNLARRSELSERQANLSITVVGSIAFDAVQTPFGERERMLGGAATHFALAASLLSPVNVVGPVGDDFGDAELAVLSIRDTNIDDVERVDGGKTFFWKGRYHDDLNTRDTLETQLNVFEHFDPKLSPGSRDAEVLFLANIQPGLQLQVREQCAAARFVALDSMNLWIDIARDELVEIIGEVDCLILNDEELRQLTGKPNLISAAREILNWSPSAPSIIVAKQGEYGSALITADDFFALPAYPLEQVVDPTGAGDTFAGGFVGLIANWIHGGAGIDSGLLRNAMAYGTALASFNVERFGTEALEAADPQAVLGRVADLWRFGRFDRLDVELR